MKVAYGPTIVPSSRAPQHFTHDNRCALSFRRDDASRESKEEAAASAAAVNESKSATGQKLRIWAMLIGFGAFWCGRRGQGVRTTAQRPSSRRLGVGRTDWV